MSSRRRNETDEQRARRELISDFLSAANIRSMKMEMLRVLLQMISITPTILRTQILILPPISMII